MQKSMLFYPLDVGARSRAKSRSRSNIPENGAVAADISIFRARRTSVIRVFPPSRILFWISRGWPPYVVTATTDANTVMRTAAWRFSQSRSIAFQNAVDISDHAMLFSLLTVRCKTLLYSSGSFFFLQKAK